MNFKVKITMEMEFPMTGPLEILESKEFCDDYAKQRPGELLNDAVTSKLMSAIKVLSGTMGGDDMPQEEREAHVETLNREADIIRKALDGMEVEVIT